MEGDSHNIERLQKELYSPQATGPIIDRTKGVHMAPGETSGNQVWPETKMPERRQYSYEPSSHFFKRLFIISIVFCIAAAGIAGYVFWSGWNQVSSNNLDVAIAGPVSVAGGETVSFAVDLTNRNRVDLLNTVVRVEYPEGAHDVTGSPLLRDERQLDTITSGSQKETKFDAVLFGEENTPQNIVVHVQYRIPGSDTVYTKDKTYSLLLTKAPISILVDYPTNANANQVVTFHITAVSNSRAPLTNVLLKMTYPTGFNFSTSTLATLNGTSDTWKLGNFDPGQKRTLTVQGVIRGQNQDDKVFKFALGSPQSANAQLIQTAFSSFVATVHLDNPFITTNLNLGTENDAGDTVMALGGSVQGSLNFVSNLTHDLIDVSVQIIPHGAYIDTLSITTPSGFYKSVSNTLYWDKNTKSDLKVMSPGDSQTVTFSWNTLPTTALTQLTRNPQMSVDALISGRTISDTGGNQTITISATKNIKFTTSAALSLQTLYSTGPFRNTGPVPPRAEQKTTYTVQLKISNSSNQLSNAVLATTLPIYVQWTGSTTPSSENISYNADTRTVTWNAGDVPAYAGVRGPFKTAAFKVELFPSTSQIGVIPSLTSTINMSAVDPFTGNVIKLNANGATTGTADGASAEVKP